MDYFSILNLKAEPFSNSPDPTLFFHSRQHRNCLQKLELSIRMHRGLNVVLGDVGTGKTTLCRQLIRLFAEDDHCEAHLILDPDFSTPEEFLRAVAGMFCEQGAAPADDEDGYALKERIKTYLFDRGVAKEQTVVLIIDEGQKIPTFCIESLREFLNYETNEFKLLQIVIFAQKEFETTLSAHENFADRISLFHELKPLSFSDTRAMIRFRIARSSAVAKPPSIFSGLGLWAIYNATGGYPRKIVNLCHQSILAMIIQNRSRAGWRLVTSCAKRSFSTVAGQKRWIGWGAAAICVALILGGIGFGLQNRVGPADTEQVKPSNHKIAMSDADVVVEKRTSAHVIKLQRPVVVSAASGPIDDLSGETKPSVSRASTDDGVLKTDGHSDKEGQLGRASGVKEAEALPAGGQEGIRSSGLRTREEAAVSAAVPPALLGEAALKKGEILSWMCVKVYGFYNRELLSSLRKANPGLRDPNNLVVNRAIAFPARPVEIRSSNHPAWWVKIWDADQLAEALDKVRDHSSRSNPVRIIPHWTRERGLVFSVVLWKYFANESKALAKLAQLADLVDSNMTVFSTWGRDAILYADPFSGSQG